jgi:hypothetical protein
MKKIKMEYTEVTLANLARRVWGENSTEFLAGALQSVTTEKQMKTLINYLQQQQEENKCHLT